MAQKTTTLYSPTGEEYATSDRVEITRLKAHGYSEQPPKKKPQTKKS
jgi:hypothetical protein